jgi:hypothetical protein
MGKLVVAVLVFMGGVVAWCNNTTLSHDTTVIGIGILFGVCAPLPVLLISVISQEMRERRVRLSPPRYRVIERRNNKQLTVNQ